MQAIDALDPVNVVECDVRIAHLWAEIRRVQNIRNSYSPISRLPTEVLCNIFICVRNLSRWYRRVSNSGPAVIPPFIKSTTHVCCHWRIAAINCPELWSRITFNGPQKWVTLQLQRAKKSLLSILLSPHMQVNHMLRPCLSQLQSLTIAQATPANIVLYTTLLRGAQAPSLERLEIIMCGNLEKNHHLPADLFDEGIPSLRHLSLRRVILPFTSPIFKGLHSLTLMTMYSSPGFLDQFLDALDRSPNLETFEVHFKFSEHSLLYTHRPQAVTLPKIKSFWLAGTMTNCTAIFQHLILPRSATMKVVIQDPPVDSDLLVVQKGFCAAIQQTWLSGADEPRGLFTLDFARSDEIEMSDK